MEFAGRDDAPRWLKPTVVSDMSFSRVGQHHRENWHGEDVTNFGYGELSEISEMHEREEEKRMSFRSAPAVCSLSERAVSAKEAVAVTGGSRVDAWLSCASSAAQAPPAALFDLGVDDQVSSSARSFRCSDSDASCTRSNVSLSGFPSYPSASSGFALDECVRGHSTDEAHGKNGGMGRKCPHLNKEILDPMRNSPVHYRGGALTSHSPVSAISWAAPGEDEWSKMPSSMRSSRGSASSSSRGDFTKSRRLAKRLKQGKTVTM
jgi:hypothetical protein